MEKTPVQQAEDRVQELADKLADARQAVKRARDAERKASGEPFGSRPADYIRRKED